MDRAPCFNTLATNQHLARKDAADSALDDLHAELTNDMQKALAGLQGHVPSFNGLGAMPREVLKSAADEVVEALDYMETAAALMLVLKDSACPLVANLRRAVVDRYVESNADSIAEARGLQ